MGKIKYTYSNGIPHQSFADEFLTHRKCSEWWYSTGYFFDESNINTLINSPWPGSR